MQAHILAIDCNEEKRQMDQAYWAELGISIDFVSSIEQAIQDINNKDYLIAVIISDNLYYLPKLSEFIAVSKCPVVVLSSGYTHAEKLVAMRAGVIAYLGDMSLSAAAPCIWFLICQLHHPRTKPVEPLQVITHRNILLCEQCHIVFVNGEKIDLTHKEFVLLEYLLNNAGRIKTHEQIYSYVWKDDDFEYAKKYVSNLVSRLNQSLNIVLKDKLISSAWETGYRIDIRSH